MLWKEVGGSIQSIHCQKFTLRYVNTIINNLLWWSHMTYNATINILLEGGRVEIRRRRTMRMVNGDGGRQRRHAWLGGGLRWGRMRAGGERWGRQRSGDDGWGSGWRQQQGRQRQRRTTTACKIGRWPMKGAVKSGRQETAETRSGDDGCGGGRWWWWTTTAVDDDSGDGGWRQRQRRTTTAVSDDSGGRRWLTRMGGRLQGGRRRAGSEQQQH